MQQYALIMYINYLHCGDKYLLKFYNKDQICDNKV